MNANQSNKPLVGQRMPEPAGDSSLFLLKGGIVVNHDFSAKADVLVHNGIIKEISTNLPIPNGAKVFDVTDQYILPGGVDLDCHLTVANPEDPVGDTYLSGSQSALLGGTTTIVNTVYTEPDASILNAFDQFTNSAADNVACDYGVCMRLPRFDSSIEEQLAQLVKEKGVCLIQLSLGSGNQWNSPYMDGALTDVAFHRALRVCREHGILPIVVASAPAYLVDQLTKDLQSKHPNIGPELLYYNQPERGEVNTIMRAALHAFHSGHVCPILISRIHSHTALQCFLEQRKNCRGLLFGQTTICAIGAPLSAFQTTRQDNSDITEFTLSKDWKIAANYTYEPPIRPDVNLAERLLALMANNDNVTVGSGHRAIRTDVRASFGLHNSARIPKGVSSLGCRLPVLWNCGVENHGGLNPCTFVRSVSADPARLANLYPQKGRIAVGSDADIVIWSKVDGLTEDGYKNLLPEGVYNVFSGLELRSRPDMVFLRGSLVVVDGKLVERQGVLGKYLPLKPFGQFAFNRLKAIDGTLKTDRPTIPREPYTGKVAGSEQNQDNEKRESHFFRKEHYDNIPKVALPPGQRQIHTSVKTAQPPGGSSHSFW
ncbi:hypothetical protein AHF37_10475 [Paragonimus kellicotti]|nr:hypothetical protein AHF37_10475 [Paragonimus kellicotti]